MIDEIQIPEQAQPPAKKRGKIKPKRKNVTRKKPDPNQAPQPYVGPLKKVKIRVPVCGDMGTPHDRGNIASLPLHVADAYIADGVAVELSEVPLKDAIKAVKKHGGEVSCDADNALFIQACEEAAADIGEDFAFGVSLENTKPELLEFAKEQGIDVDKRATKADILDAIYAAQE